MGYRRSRALTRRGLLFAPAAVAAQSAGWSGGSVRSIPGGTFLRSNASLSQPSLGEGQLRFRLALARSRTGRYPLDRLDFIMADLERPDLFRRHADWWTGDLSGRLVEFLSNAEGVDGQSDPRLPAVFERILRQRRPSGLFGRYAQFPDRMVPPEDVYTSGSNRLFNGLIRYYELTRDERAADAAQGIANHLVSKADEWRKSVKDTGSLGILFWVTEPLARLYGIVKNQRYLDFCAMIREGQATCEKTVHAHGFMSMLRGLQMAALLTGDSAWNEKPERNRRLIIDNRYELPDGCISEVFPRSQRNEGCAIADWLMLNLNAGLIRGDDSAYEHAERVFWNALAFNQWNTGGFGHQWLIPGGYGMLDEEAWWCCLYHAGIAMTEYARHAVTFRDGVVRVNFLLPGRFLVAAGRKAKVEVTIQTSYPATATAEIVVVNVPPECAVKLRVPGCVKDAQVSEARSGDRVRLSLQGRLGHRLEEASGGVTLTYGPLILAPLAYFRGPRRLSSGRAAEESTEGYVPGLQPAEGLTLQPQAGSDHDGFLQLNEKPLPTWLFFEDGPGGRFWVPGAAVNVPLKLRNGEKTSLRFSPLSYNTACLVPSDTPVLFHVETEKG